MIPPGVGVGTFAATSKNAAANNPVSIFATLLIPRIYRNFSDNRRYAIGPR
jgi:O-antigen/teichoic acid export membrane protein